jgi:hypothetical protein
MNAKSEILKNSLLNEAEINYNKDRYTQIQNQESEAEIIIRQSKISKEFIEQINGMSNYKPQKQDGKVVSRGLKQFLDTAEQRDLLVSVWILAKSKDKTKAQKYGIDIKEPEGFDKELKRIASDTRKVAKKLDKKNPSPQEVEKVLSDREEDKPPQEEKPSSKETESDNQEPEDDSDYGDEEVDTSFPPKDDGEGSDDEESEEEGDDNEEEPRKKQASDLINKKDFPPPKEQAKDFEEFKDEKIKEIEDAFSAIKEPTREQQARYDKAKSRVDKILNNNKEKILNRQRGYEVHATQSSAIKASTSAKKLANNAKREVNDVVSKFKRSNMPGRLERAGMKVKEIGQSVSDTAKKAAESRAAQTSKDAIKRAAGKGSDMVKRGAKQAGEKIASTTEKVKENVAARAIEKYLGPEKRNEYVENLRKGNAEEAEKIRQEGITKAKEQKQGKRDEREQSRYDRMRSKTQQENYILKNYMNKINELADNPSTREEEKDTGDNEILKIAKSSLGEKGAEDYKKKMENPSSEEKEEAIEMLKKAEEEEQEKKKKLGINDTKKQNEAVKRVLKSLYS